MITQATFILMKRCVKSVLNRCNGCREDSIRIALKHKISVKISLTFPIQILKVSTKSLSVNQRLTKTVNSIFVMSSGVLLTNTFKFRNLHFCSSNWRWTDLLLLSIVHEFIGVLYIPNIKMLSRHDISLQRILLNFYFKQLVNKCMNWQIYINFTCVHQ